MIVVILYCTFSYISCFLLGKIHFSITVCLSSGLSFYERFIHFFDIIFGDMHFYRDILL